MAGEQLDLNIATTITGMAAFDQAAAGINQVQSSTQSLNDTQRTLRKETEAAAAAIRGQRMATTQLGMQISQVGTQMASGTSVGQIFAQQIGDIGYALSGMSGRLGAVGAFLSGPWGVGLSIAAMALIPLISNLMDAKEAAVDLAQTSEETQSAIQNYYKAIGYTEPVEKGIASARRMINSLIEERQEALKTAQAHMMRMKVILQSNMSVVRGEDNIFRKLFGDNPAEKAAAANAVVEGLIGQIQQLQGALNKPVKMPASSKVNAPSVGAGSRASSGIAKAKGDVNDFNDFVKSNIADTMKSLDAYSKAYASTTSDNVKMAVQAFDEQRSYEEKIKDYALSKDQERATKVIDAYNAVGNAVADSFKGMITGAQSFGDAFKNIIGSVIDELFRLYVVQQIVGMVKGALGSVFGVPSMTGKAIGGSVQSGQPYMVGERGPEVFVPSRGGSIVPNGGTGGGINISVDARGASDPAAVRQQVELGIAQAAPYIIAAAQNRTLKSASRTRLPGTIG